MRYHDGLSAAGPRPYGTHGTYGIYGNNAAYPGNLAERGLLAPVLFASAMSLGANMAAVRAQALVHGRCSFRRSRACVSQMAAVVRLRLA